MAYKLSEWRTVGRLWRQHFPELPLASIYCGELSAVLQEVKIDLDALDRCLQHLYPEESETSSMAEIITRHYGDKTCAFIEELL